LNNTFNATTYLFYVSKQQENQEHIREQMIGQVFQLDKKEHLSQRLPNPLNLHKSSTYNPSKG
jgi:hypothetical protein